MNGYINSQNIVEKVETWIDDALFGDLLFDAVYSDYKDFGGVKFPTRIVQNQGGYPIFDLRISDVRPNTPVTIQAAQGGGGGAVELPHQPRRQLRSWLRASFSLPAVTPPWSSTSNPTSSSSRVARARSDQTR